MKNNNKNIAVIGAGLTGLVAAYRLSQKGHTVVVLEKSKTVGGLLSGFKLEGVNLEKAYHFLYKTDKHIISLVKELGIRKNLRFHKSSLSTYSQGKLYPMMTPIDLLRFTPLSFLNRLRAGLTIFYLQHVRFWKKLEKISAYDWLLKWAGTDVTKIIWEPLLKGKFGSYYDKVTMSWLWKRILVRVQSKDKGETTEKLGYFDGGWQILIDVLVDKIESNGGRIIKDVNIQSIDKKRDDGSVSISINKSTQVFDSVVATIPSYIFGNLIKNNNKPGIQSYLKKLNSIDYLGAIVAVFTSNQRLTKYYWHNINDSSVPFLVLLSLTELVGVDGFNGKHVYYIGAYVKHNHEYFHKQDKDIKQEWLKGLNQMFPVFNKDKIGEWNLFRFRNAQHIVDLNYPNKISSNKTPLNGVFLSNFTQIYPDDRQTNYAVRDGDKVAELVDEYLLQGINTKVQVPKSSRLSLQTFMNSRVLKNFAIEKIALIKLTSKYLLSKITFNNS